MQSWQQSQFTLLTKPFYYEINVAIDLLCLIAGGLVRTTTISAMTVQIVSSECFTYSPQLTIALEKLFHSVWNTFRKRKLNHFKLIVLVFVIFSWSMDRRKYTRRYLVFRVRVWHRARHKTPFLHNTRCTRKQILPFSRRSENSDWVLQWWSMRKHLES